MSAKWERDSEASKGTLTFEIDVETAKKGIDQAFKRTQKRITVPGFRKGHVPRQLFNQMYGEEALYQDALNIVLPKAYEDAVKETGIEPVDQPQIDVKSLEKGQPWVLTAEVAVKPEVKLGDYKGMEVPAQDTTVSDKEVEDELESKRQQQAELVLKEDQPAENGDTVVIDYVGSVDGEKFDGGSADNYSLELGSGAFIPGFEDQLVGHKSGEDVEVKVTFPEEYHAQDLAGKEAVFEVKLHEVKEKQLPEMDDEFAKDVDEDVDTLDELKEKTKKQLQEQKEDAAHAARSPSSRCSHNCGCAGTCAPGCVRNRFGPRPHFASRSCGLLLPSDNSQTAAGWSGARRGRARPGRRWGSRRRLF